MFNLCKIECFILFNINFMKLVRDELFLLIDLGKKYLSR